MNWSSLMSAMTFEKWCSYKKRVMGELPAWFSNSQEREWRYNEYVRAFESCCVSHEEVASQPIIPLARAA
jgi:hypothetical protein